MLWEQYLVWLSNMTFKKGLSTVDVFFSTNKKGYLDLLTIENMRNDRGVDYKQYDNVYSPLTAILIFTEC